MALDKIHYAVRRALEKAGWTITSDPYILVIPDLDAEVDLEAQKMMKLEKENRKILVEIKSFLRISIQDDFYRANGQYDFYKDRIQDLELEHNLYLAISTVTYFRLSQAPTYLRHLDEHNVKLLIIDLNTETIKEWIE